MYATSSSDVRVCLDPPHKETHPLDLPNTDDGSQYVAEYKNDKMQVDKVVRGKCIPHTYCVSVAGIATESLHSKTVWHKDPVHIVNLSTKIFAHLHHFAIIQTLNSYLLNLCTPPSFLFCL